MTFIFISSLFFFKIELLNEDDLGFSGKKKTCPAFDFKVPALIPAVKHNFCDGSVHQLPYQISVFLEMSLALEIILVVAFKCVMISEI